MSGEKIQGIIKQATEAKDIDFLFNSIRDTREYREDTQGGSETIAYYNERLDIYISQIDDEEIREEIESERETVTQRMEEDAQSNSVVGFYLGTMMRELGALTRKLHQPTSLKEIQARLKASS